MRANGRCELVLDPVCENRAAKPRFMAPRGFSQRPMHRCRVDYRVPVKLSGSHDKGE